MPSLGELAPSWGSDLCSARSGGLLQTLRHLEFVENGVAGAECGRRRHRVRCVHHVCASYAPAAAHVIPWATPRDSSTRTSHGHDTHSESFAGASPARWQHLKAFNYAGVEGL